MKKLSILLSMLLVVAAGAQGLGRLPGVVSVLDRGQKTDTTIRQALIDSTNRNVSLILDGGEWIIGTNLTIPPRASLYLTRESYFTIRTNKTLTILGNFHADVHNVFQGPGSAVGSGTDPANFPFRITNWGDQVQYNIGLGYIQVWVTNQIDALASAFTFETNASYAYPPPTTQDFWNIIVRSNATFLGPVTIQGPLTTYGQTNHGNIETDTLQVNSNIAFGPGVLTNMLYPARYSMETNRPFFGFLAISPTNRSQVFAADTFTKMTNIAIEQVDSHSVYSGDRFTPTNAGWWAIGGSTIDTRKGHGGSDRTMLLAVRNGLPSANPVTTNSRTLTMHYDPDAEAKFYGGECMMYADGMSDYFELYFYSENGVNTNKGASFYAHFLGL